MGVPGTPKMESFLTDNAIQMNDWGVPLFEEPFI